MRLAVLVACGALLAAAFLPFVAAQGAEYVRICYDDRDGDCEVNLFILPENHWMLGSYIVCDGHFVANTQGSTACPSTSPGVSFDCGPSLGGYCNATILHWEPQRYDFEFTVTGGPATLRLNNLGPGTYGVTLGAATLRQHMGTSIFSLDLEEGAGQRLKLIDGSGLPSGGIPGGESGSNDPPGSVGGSNGGGGGGSGGPAPIIVNLPNAPVVTPDPFAKVLFILLGIGLVGVGHPPIFHYFGAKKIAAHKPQPWVTVLGILIFTLSIIAATST